MPYTASLDGRPLGGGSMPEVTAVVADTVTALLALDNEANVGRVHEAFRTGAVVDIIATHGYWQATLQIQGKLVTLRVEGATMCP